MGLSKSTKIGGLVVVIVFIIFIVLYFVFFGKKGTFATFGDKAYRGISSYKNVTPFVNFYKQNQQIRDRWEFGTLQISEVYIPYKKFYNSKNVEDVPVVIMEEIGNAVAFMESGQDFTNLSTEPFQRLGITIINMDRLMTQYFESLSISKDKMGGRDINASKSFDDYVKVNQQENGFIKTFLDSAMLEHYATNDKNAAKFREDVTSDLVMSSLMNSTDPRANHMMENDYQNYWDDKHAGSRYKSAKAVYDSIDKRFPGTFERRVLDDEPFPTYEKDPKDPNVPRPGIIGRVSDQPYAYDIYAKNYIRSF